MTKVRWHRTWILGLVATIMVAAPAYCDDAKAKPNTLTVVVMDPLALPLSCPCVAGYAQRDYEKFGQFLEKKLGRPVQVQFSESLKKAMQDKTEGKADIVIGKKSVVDADAKSMSLKFDAFASLTDKTGETTQYGMIVVATKDSAKSASDLKDYRIVFGPEEAEEKHGAAITLLKDSGIAVGDKLEMCGGCDEGVKRILEKTDQKGAAVISSYAHPLLEGCGNVPKGAIRVVAKTKPVPFVTAFLSGKLSVTDRDAIKKAMFEMGSDAELCVALETANGFVPYAADAQNNDVKKKQTPAGN